MRSIYDLDPIRIPVKLVDGQWEYFYGGGLPIKNGTVGDLVIDKSSIEDKEFLANLKRASKHKILEAGTQLLVALTVKNPQDMDQKLKSQLLPVGKNGPVLGDAYYSTARSADTRFLKISIGGPTASQKRHAPMEKGGVWLHVEGLIPKGVSSSTIQLPGGVWDRPADSLNHAFTLLSERYEPWRKSHTGNIYDRMLYQESNGKWYPLNVLRDAAIASDEHQFIRGQWQQIAQAISRQNGV
jgi:hypothetical protein